MNCNDTLILQSTFGGSRVNFVPVYLNCNHWRNDFDKLKTFFAETALDKFIVFGDMNVRTGTKGSVDISPTALNSVAETRCSKDTTCDSNCNLFLELLEDVGAFILNGWSFNDRNGEYTFVSSRGSSVIDYCCPSYATAHLIEDFAVGTETFSDHMPITFSLKDFIRSDIVINTNYLPRLKWTENRCQIYVKKLETALRSRTFTSSSIENRCNAIKDCIYEANGRGCGEKMKFDPKKPWFDLACNVARKTTFKNLKTFRKFNLDVFRIKYAAAKKHYKNLCKIKKREYYQNIITQLNRVSTSKEWWRLAKEIRGDNPNSTILLTAEIFKSHFQILLSEPAELTPSYPDIPAISVSQLDRRIEKDEILLAITTSKNKKAPGIDGIPYEYYKNASPALIDEIYKLFNDIFETAIIPTSFKQSIIYPLLKKGNANDVTNYRGLSFLDTLYKMFTSVLLNRLTVWVEENNILNEYQAAYRNNYSTVDQIYNLTCLIQLQLSQKRKLYAFFVDLKAAFDNVSRNALFYKLATLGISSKMINILKLIYKDTTAAVWDGKSRSDFFPTNKGVKQGCVLSALLFILFLNDLHTELPTGLTLEGLRMNVLLYADDIVILSHSAFNLQVLIDSFIAYCTKWSLTVNLDKSEIVIFRNGGRRAAQEKWFFRGEEISVTNQYKYLGVILNYNMSWTDHLNSRLTISKNSINSTWSQFLRNKSIRHSAKFKIHDAASRTIMMYCAQVWGYKEHVQVEKLQRFFLKRCFLLPNNTPNYVLHIETGLPKSFLTTLKLHFSFISRVMELPNNRLPKILSEIIIRKNIYWANEWMVLFSEASIDLSFSSNILEIRNSQNVLLSKLREKHWSMFISNAQQSQFHDEYSNLSYCDIPNYFLDSNPQEMITLILKARSGLLTLNARAFQNHTIGLCTMCNLDASENTYHFVGVCPIFSGYRKQFLGSHQLTRSQFLEYLNGQCYSNLYLFLKSALKYRFQIMNEFF